ncbi:hypothetical protein [Alienimonas chondri]|uniref:Uncharacterized protein n=1 Tax=Alienimonas chondri TaxID=2681879 RepID=A0ABX1VCZ8_9PLAN|nr:hypothetical protein [Alienimonas chondri]NNJ24916.1 hypothetical protein [Alienimonas chondri]
MKWILSTVLASLVAFALVTADPTTLPASSARQSVIAPESFEGNNCRSRIAPDRPTFRDLIEEIGGDDDISVSGTVCWGPDWDERPLAPDVSRQVLAGLLAEPCPSLVCDCLVMPCPPKYTFNVRAESGAVHVEISSCGGLIANLGTERFGDEMWMSGAVTEQCRQVLDFDW